MILRSIPLCKSPSHHLNISGPEILSIRELALRFGKIMNKEVLFKESDNSTALLVNSSQAYELLGKPKVTLDQVINWTANWIKKEKKTHNKPTRFEVRDGNY